MTVRGAELPGHKLDGYDAMDFFTGESATSPREEYVYFGHQGLEAMRKGDWKLRLAGGHPELFDLQLDPSERYNRADEKHEIVRKIYREMVRYSEETGVDISESSIRIPEKP